MKWRHWSVLIVLVLLNYIIFSTAFTQLAEQRRPGPRPTRTPWPTFESLEPTPAAWIVLPTSTVPPTETPLTPTPTSAVVTAETVATVQATATAGVPATEAPPTPSSSPVPTNTPRPPTPTAPGEAVTHTVKRGETLSEIAQRYDVTVQAIVEANGLENPSLIITGQKLIIPEPGQVPPTATPGARPTATPKATATTPLPPTSTRKPATLTPTSEPPTSTPTPAAGSFQFTAEVVWDPLVAPNCSGPAISKQSVIVDAGGNPVNGVQVEVDCYGNVLLSHESGTPGEYDPGHYDFSFGQNSPQDWTCTARVVTVSGQPVDSSQEIEIHFDTNDCNPHGSGHQVAIVNWTKHW